MRIYLIAGEPSGDLLGAALMRGLKELVPGVTFTGVGGPAMCAEGMESQFPMDELSVMGLAEVLPKYFHLKRRIRECAEAVLAQKPDLMITIDSPDFSLRVAKLVKAASDIRTVHYVAPTVWAWRPKRAGKMAKMIDHVLALFPFEPPYMEAAGMACDFVGHPVTTRPQASEAEAAAFRLQQGLGEAPVVLLLPGSRRGEVTRLAPVLGVVLDELRARYPDLRAVLPAAAPVAGLVRDLVESWPVKPLILDPTGQDSAAFEATKRAAFRAADVAVAASGTVSLELAAAGTPMVIAYDMAPLTRFILKRMMLVDTVTLVNLVSDTRAVPEFLGENCRADLIAPAVAATLKNPGPQQQAMTLTMDRLGRGGEAPGLRAARAVLARL
ncbi:lipid-A-disaccharide synthase [Pseudooceanicola nanhaiensis]|uniref:lipid-A-disaccharide synthase n=1 Tax=Pseudooceanicola nanhaiensis TaxID=375761 RepID=UPI001CD59124|nr:lipid-A-disaccharide synthase [Pseudooceanicola nanhaiensis]MCA0919731.1 lipid-A-disaccharide synthase [Pseudooceanicola nanhaiensis]